MRYIIFLLTSFFVIVGVIGVSPVIAAEKQICDNRFVTLINPVRGRDLWNDKTINPLKSQYGLIEEHQISATWLIQYDAIIDRELLAELLKFNKLQEKGAFLEVSPHLAQDARVLYPNQVPWFSPQAVFLSGYSQSDRRRLIDTLFSKFKSKFGFYPKSIGAWWIDSYSLNYMKEKYGIVTAMIVADQKTTDNYGVWGQWWGMPYYPSRANILTPASSLNNKVNVVIVQWAQRDPKLAYGDGMSFSNYSLQANDYIRQGKDTAYFAKLINAYLDCNNLLGQVTVGLETGMESSGYLSEYKNQLDLLKKIPALKFLTMAEFAEKYASIYPEFPKQATVSSENSVWNLTTLGRLNKLLGDTIAYDGDISFKDYFVADNDKFLNRQLLSTPGQKNVAYFPWFLLSVIALLLVSLWKKQVNIWAVSILFSLGAFGLILRSYYSMGWAVYFGPEIGHLQLFQWLLIFASFGIIFFLEKYNIFRINYWILPFVFGLDFLILAARFTNINGKYFFGFALDSLRFIGISFKPPFYINLINQDFLPYISSALLRLDFNQIQNSILNTFLWYLMHFISAFLIGIILIKLPKNLGKLFIAVLIILFVFQLVNIFTSDPRLAIPILLQ